MNNLIVVSNHFKIQKRHHMREDPKRPYKDMAINVLSACLAWIGLWPVTLIVPRKRSLWIVYGRDGGKFLDNCKYFYIRLCERSDLGLVPIYLCKSDVEVRAIRDHGLRAEIARGVRGLWFWLRAGTIIVDNVDWKKGGGFQAARGAQIIQLWHGIPLKYIQRSRIRHGWQKRSRADRVLFLIYLTILGRRSNVDWLLSTSEFVTDKTFRDAFRFRRVSNTGYPRNDALFGSENSLAQIGLDQKANSAIRAYRECEGKTVALYAPTFRESFEDPFQSGRIDLAALSSIREELNVLILIKMHPWIHNNMKEVHENGIVFVAPDSDIYPVLDQVDVLVTDYSSIYFDFLLLNRPVIFYCYDLDEYLKHERQMYFDYQEMTPGPKVMDLEALERELSLVSSGHDDWAGERERIVSRVFDHRGPDASDRLIENICDS